MDVSMINDFNNGTVGWTDWNVLLDETGGPIMLIISVLLLFMPILLPAICIF